MTRTVHPIERESYLILRSRAGTSRLPPWTRAVVERVIHASADPGYASDLVCREEWLAAGARALRAGAPVVADSAMVAAGITARGVICHAAGDGPAAALAAAEGITRSAAGIRLAWAQAGPGAVWVIGTAPTALAEVLALGVDPALVIGLPVGFVGAVEAKRALLASGLPAVTNRGEKGGAAVAAAALNALLYATTPAPAGPPLPATPSPPAGPPVPATTPSPSTRAPHPAAPPAPAGPPLLLVGHGTRSGAGVAEFGRLVQRVRARGVAPVVDGGFIELAAPSVSEAVARMDGAGRPWELVAVPVVLTAAGHGKGDIPASMARELVRHPGLSYRYGRPLGPHPVLQDILAARIGAALAGAPPGGTHVVLVGRGSTDPDANAEVAKVARLLWEGRGYDAVELAFISLTGPSVPEALEQARRLGARRIVVAPYFLFSGVLPDRVAAQAREFGRRHPVLDVRVAGLIGDCEELADLVLERYREAIAGDIRMNCDSCAYRVALPGFADKVGRPQLPHHHPHDTMAPGPAHAHGPVPGAPTASQHEVLP